LRESEPPSSRYAIREITLTREGEITRISEDALSPKAGSPAELREKLTALLSRDVADTFQCGESGRSFTRAEVESWLRVIGRPVLKIIEK
jgi:hypothetical protein